MTLGEKALESFEKARKRDIRLSLGSYYDGYIAGATDNGFVWHDLRKNPKDLPKNSDDEKQYSIYWGENDYGVVLFCDGRWWSFDSGWYDAKEAIAWCEIPKFEEAED